MPRTGSVDRFGAGGRALDLCGARADLAGLAAGECPGAVDRGDGAAHTGYTDPALRERKLQLDCKILEAELAERSDDPFVLFNPGDRRRAARLADRPGPSPAQPARIGPHRFHRAQALRPDRPLPPDARRASVGSERVFRGPTHGPRRRRAAFPQSRPAPQGGPAGRGRSRLAADLDAQAPDEFCSVDQGIYGYLTLRSPPSWPRNAATRPRPGGSGGWSSTRVPAIPRPCREGKRNGKSRSLPPHLVSPTPSASAREVSRDTDNPAPTMKRPGGGGRGLRARH